MEEELVFTIEEIQLPIGKFSLSIDENGSRMDGALVDFAVANDNLPYSNIPSSKISIIPGKILVRAGDEVLVLGRDYQITEDGRVDILDSKYMIEGQKISIVFRHDDQESTIGNSSFIKNSNDEESQLLEVGNIIVFQLRIDPKDVHSRSSIDLFNLYDKEVNDKNAGPDNFHYYVTNYDQTVLKQLRINSSGELTFLTSTVDAAIKIDVIILPKALTGVDEIYQFPEVSEIKEPDVIDKGKTYIINGEVFYDSKKATSYFNDLDASKARIEVIHESTEPENSHSSNSLNGIVKIHTDQNHNLQIQDPSHSVVADQIEYNIQSHNLSKANDTGLVLPNEISTNNVDPEVYDATNTGPVLIKIYGITEKDYHQIYNKIGLNEISEDMKEGKDSHDALFLVDGAFESKTIGKKKIRKPFLTIDGVEKPKARNLRDLKLKYDDILLITMNKRQQTVHLRGSKNSDVVVDIYTRELRQSAERSLNDISFVESERTERDPLIVVDGKVHTESVLEQVEPEDINSITVLKDNSAYQLFGEMASNGVVLVTTKNADIEIHESHDISQEVVSEAIVEYSSVLEDEIHEEIREVVELEINASKDESRDQNVRPTANANFQVEVIPTEGGQMRLILTSDESDDINIYGFDVLGRLLFKERAENIQESVEISHSFLNIPSQRIVIVIVEQNGQITSEKVYLP